MAQWNVRRLILPAASEEALKAMRQEVRRWGLQNRTDLALDDLARLAKPYIGGWINGGMLGAV